MLNKSVSEKYFENISVWWDALPDIRKYWLIFGSFLGFFLLLLLPIPVSGSLFGSVDTFFVPALANTYLNGIREAILGEFIGQSMYPADIIQFGENFIGVSSIFMLFKVLGVNDIYSLYLTQVCLLSSMAFAAVLLAKEYTQSISSAVFVAFVFTTSNFVWAAIDHLAIHYYFWALLSAYFLKRAIQEKSSRQLMAAGIAGGIQFYFSVQVFIYQCLILTILVLFSLRELWAGYSLKEKSLFAALYVIIPLPLFLFYLNTVINIGVVDVFPRTQWEVFYSLQLSDFLKALPNKLIHYPFVIVSAGGWHQVAHSAFIGLAAPVLAFVALMKGFSKQKFELIVIAILGLFFALGTTIAIGGSQITSPLLLFYKYFPLAEFLRVELRSYSLVLLSISILAGMGWERIAKGLAKTSRALPSIGLIFAFLFVAAENISWPLNEYETIKYPAIPGGYTEFFADKPEARILDLPSNSTTNLPGYIDEIIYVLWQTEHKRDILGGVTGHYPLSRIRTQKYVDLLPSKEAFRYLKSLGVTHIVWHDSSTLVCHIFQPPGPGCNPATGSRLGMGAEGYSWLEDSPFLKLVFENDVIRIYEAR